MYQLIHLLNTYSRASGQRINLAKSGLVCDRFLPVKQRTRMANIMEIQVWAPGNVFGSSGGMGKVKARGSSMD